MSQRVLRINELVKEELSQILKREIEFPKHVLVTITRVETSVDLDQATVFVAVFPEKNKESILQVLRKSIYHLQQKLNRRLRIQPIPKIYFVLEKETAKAGKIEELLEELKKRGK